MEIANVKIEHYFRCYVNYIQNNWKRLLLIAEFVINNSILAIIGIIPFFANKGYNFCISFDLKLSIDYFMQEKRKINRK